MYKKYYQLFLKQNPKVLHLASHSHHFWPDVTRQAHLDYWDEASRFVDDKWSVIFSKKIPKAQSLIAEILNLNHPEQIVFAPNTHELVMRLLSCFNFSTGFKVLTTDSEFYSFDRQITAAGEHYPQISITRTPTQDFSSFAHRFISTAQQIKPDLIFFSHVFFNSGLACKLEEIIPYLPKESTIVVDGYHGFMALPTNLAPFERQIFYLAGSYKYAQGGEGACFLYSPPQTKLKPTYTGWFAELTTLNQKSEGVPYPNDGMRFAGSTMDFSALYRLIAVLELFKQDGVTVERIHSHIHSLQQFFLQKLDDCKHPHLNRQNLVCCPTLEQGHFLAFKLPDADYTKSLVEDLRLKGIWTDSRKNIIRFGFGLHLDINDLEFFSIS